MAQEDTASAEVVVNGGSVFEAIEERCESGFGEQGGFGEEGLRVPEVGGVVDIAVAIEHATDQEREEVAFTFLETFYIEFKEVGEVDIVFEFFAVISFHDDG